MYSRRLVCPDPIISIITDCIFLAFASWFFLAFLYYTHRHENDNQSNKAFGKQLQRKIKGLRRLVVSRMQIIAAILSSIIWTPDIPKFLVDALNFISSIFTVNVPGLLTSVDCVSVGGDGGGGMTPINKWFLGLLFPIGVILLFGVWFRSLSKDSIAKNTVREAGVNVCFIWLFETIVTSSLKIMDCTGVATGKLIMDPSLMCYTPFHIGLVILGIIVLLIYVVLPYDKDLV